MEHGKEANVLRDKSNHSIFWDQIEIHPSIRLKFGIRARIFPLHPEKRERRGELRYSNQYATLDGRWTEIDHGACMLSLSLTNTAGESIRLTRLKFPTENGLNAFLGAFDPANISFLRNGYQSWSTARSYRVKDKPLRPWLQLVSLASSNLANLPSNHPGILSSEMYSVITDAKKATSFLVGQGPAFDQFFYIKLNLFRRPDRKNHFELVFDFGRKMISPGQTVTLDSVIMMKGETHAIVQQYFEYLSEKVGIPVAHGPIRGYSTWYYYFNKLKADDVLANLRAIRERSIGVDVVQIDDGYQEHVGDWLRLKPGFAGRMREIAEAIRQAGMRPGIWLAPFAADRKSELFRTHPDFILRNEYGRRLLGGYNVFWRGRLYYGLDITNPGVEEYVRRVIREIVHGWGFDFLKCDFLFTGALRGGDPKDLRLSRAEILKRGMRIIREEAGPGTFIVGCGMPLSAGIGLVDAMRVGPDTGPYWIKRSGKLLRTGAMVGVRNSMRNFMVRSPMHKTLWINDPDCLMLREKRTSLTHAERWAQINAIILSGGMLLFSDDLTQLNGSLIPEIDRISELNEICFAGRPVALDMMEREVPELYYNTAGFLGVFNMEDRHRTKRINLSSLPLDRPLADPVVDAWTGVPIGLDSAGGLTLDRMPPHSSILLRVH